MNIYVLRHGQTVLNVEGKFQGRIDTELTNTGIKQVEESKSDLSKIKFDLVFVSPLKRAIDTAKIVTNQELTIEPRIIERSFGKLEGKSSVLDYEERIEEFGIEPLQEIKERVDNFLDEIKEKYLDKENILIVTHEAVAQNINAYFNKVKDIKEFRLQTGTYIKYTVQSKEQLMKHLEDIELTRPCSNLNKQNVYDSGENKEKIHIVYLMVWTKVCGGSKIILEYANRLSTLGNKITIVSYDEKPYWFALDEKIDFIQVPQDKTLEQYIPECDVIVPTSWKNIYHAVNSKKAPVTFFEQGGSHIFETQNLSDIKRKTVNDRMSIVPFIHTVSSFAREKIKEEYGVDSAVICNAINSKIFYSRSSFEKEDDSISITIIGSEGFKFKNINESLLAIRKLKENYPQIVLNWISQDEPKMNKEKAIVNPKQEVIGDILRSTDIFICNSEYESFCLPALEAMSCGAAVITTDNGGIRDFIKNNDNALIIEKHNVSDLIEKVRYLINNKETRIELMKKGVETSKKFSWEASTKKMEEYYKMISRFKIK